MTIKNELHMRILLLTTIILFYSVVVIAGNIEKSRFVNDISLDSRSSRGVIQDSVSVNEFFLNGTSLSGESRSTASNKVQRIIIDGTRIKVPKPDGTLASNEDLIGAILVAVDTSGVKDRFRIDSIEKYSSDETGEIFLYTFSAQDPETGEWRNFCRPDHRGWQKGFPLNGYWDEQGNHIPSETQYSITCTSGTIGKCVLFGYLPWEKDGSGKSLWGYHQACTRLIRADYCGNGISHTRDGTLIELYDRKEIQIDTSTQGLTFEGAWNEKGAVCLRKTRIPEISTLSDIEHECPEKLRDKIGDKKCVESFDDPEVLILNRSPKIMNP